MASDGAGRVELEALARHFHERELEEDPEKIWALLHPDVEATLIVNGLQPLQGRSAIVDVLARERETMIYSAEIDQLDWVAEDVLLLSANARYALDGGLATGRIWWLDEFKDGLLFRIRAFTSEAEAQAEHQRALAALI